MLLTCCTRVFVVWCVFLLLLSPLFVHGQDPTTEAPTTNTTDTPTTDTPTTTAPTTATPTTGAPTTPIPGNGTTGNGTIPTPTPTPTNSTGNATAPALVRNPNSTRAVCTSDSQVDAILAEFDRPPWDCPRPDVDGGVLGPRNNDFDPCRNFTRYLLDNGFLKSATNSTMDFRPPDLCPRNSLASGLNLTHTYTGPKGAAYKVPTQVTKGDPYPIMLVTSNALFNYKMLFQPVVDEFTQLEIAASHGVKYFSVPNTYISVEAGGLTTGPRTRVFRTPGIGTNAANYLNAENELGLDNIRYNYLDFQGPDGNIHFPDPYLVEQDPARAGASFRYAVVPFWTVLINADNGVINDIHFDEGCDACADQLCSPDNNCGVKEYACAIQPGNSVNLPPVFSISSLSQCALDRVTYFEMNTAERAQKFPGGDPLSNCVNLTYPNTNSTPGQRDWGLATLMNADTQTDYSKNSTDCSVKVYVGWTGTDKNGKYFTSAGKRLSVFRRYSIGAAYNSATTFADNALPETPTTEPTGGGI